VSERKADGLDRLTGSIRSACSLCRAREATNSCKGQAYHLNTLPGLQLFALRPETFGIKKGETAPGFDANDSDATFRKIPRRVPHA
jgi:hypothetical protein